MDERGLGERDLRDAGAPSSTSPVPSSWATDAAMDLALLDINEFGAWQREAGIPELQVLLLLGWDPKDQRQAYPDSTESYNDTARSVILGLRMGDTRSSSFARLRRAGASTRTLDHDRFYSDERLSDLLDEILAWLPRSLDRWWRRQIGDRLRSLPFHCHLIKYDPSRSVAGYYDDGSWTAYGDVGDMFDGVVLTKDVYEAKEQAHLDAIRLMAHESHAISFVADFEHDPEQCFDLTTMLEQVRGALRGENDGWLWRTTDNSMYVISGYDYHLYVGSHLQCIDGVQLAIERGLHPRLDEGPGPYLFIE